MALALMIRMKDGREYLVPQNNLSELIEFTKTFDAEIYRVDVVGDENIILDVSQLPRALCDNDYRLNASYSELGRVVPLGRGSCDTVTHEVQTPVPVVPVTREAKQARAIALKEEISNKFLAGEVVCINELCDDHEDLSRTTLSTYLKSVRTKFAAEGSNINRIGVGKYQMGPPPVRFGAAQSYRSLSSMYSTMNYTLPSVAASTVPPVTPATDGLQITNEIPCITWDSFNQRMDRHEELLGVSQGYNDAIITIYESLNASNVLQQP